MEIDIVVSVHNFECAFPCSAFLPTGISRDNKILQLLLKEYAVPKAWLHVSAWIGRWGSQLHKRGNAGSKTHVNYQFSTKGIAFKVKIMGEHIRFEFFKRWYYFKVAFLEYFLKCLLCRHGYNKNESVVS